MAADLFSLGKSGRRKQLKDQLVSPFKVAILVMIEEHCKLMSANNKKKFNIISSDSESSNVYLDSEECTLMITMLQIVQSPDLELIELQQRLQTVAKPDLLIVMSNKLKELCNDGVHVLFDLMQNLPSNLFKGATPAMHKSSVLGLFVRRICLTFEKLSFNQVTKLYNKFCLKYREILNHRERNISRDIYDIGHDKSLNFIEMMGDKEEEEEDYKEEEKRKADMDVGKYSQRQAEYFVAQQALLLNHNELEALSPVELQKKISELLHSNPDFVEAHFLSYMNLLNVHEYCGSLDNLYRYFDRFQSLPSGGGGGGGSSGNVKSKTSSDDDPQLRNHRYAALNIAAVEYRFGHRKEAIAAIQESIRLSQESNDSICLQYSLMWLHRLGIHNESGVNFMLEKLIISSGEQSLWYLMSLSIIASVQHNFQLSIQPSALFETLSKSDVVNTQHSLSHLTCVSFAEKSMLWNSYGLSEMCLINSQLMLNLNIQESGFYRNSESECLALCHLVRLHVEKGFYDSAFEILGTARRRFPTQSQYSSLWIQCEEEIKFNLSIFRCKNGQAEEAIANLAAFNELQAAYCRCILMMEKGEIGRAFQLLENLIEECKELETSSRPVTQLVIRLLLLKGNILCCKGTTTLAIHAILEAINISKQSHFLYLASVATVHLAFVQYCLGMPRHSIEMIEKVLMFIFSHENVYNVERTKFLLIKCRVASADYDETSDRLQILSSASDKLTDILESFRRIEAFRKVKEVLYYKSRILHELGRIDERNKCSFEFRHFDEEHPTWNESLTSYF